MNELNAAAPEKPFFLYFVPGGTHAPHHPTPEWIAKMKGKFDMGWNELREQIFANQKKLGVIPANTQLTPWPDSLPKWDTLNPDSEKGVSPGRRKSSPPMSPTPTMRSAGSFRPWKTWASSITRSSSISAATMAPAPKAPRSARRSTSPRFKASTCQSRPN